LTIARKRAYRELHVENLIERGIEWEMAIREDI
jgi:hypothetical protein